MDLATKLKAFKDMQDTNAAIDSAFLAGVQSVTPMHEFTYAELRLMFECINVVDELSGRFDMNRTTLYTKKDLAARLLAEIHRREEIAAPFRTMKKEAMKNERY
jgi:hypothetical protein